MQTTIDKVRNLIQDILKTDGKDNFTFESSVSSKIFTIIEANVSASTVLVYKNGILWSILPVPGATVAWTRAGTVVTITKTSHGLITNDVITITASSATTALPLGTYSATKLTNNTFTVVGLNAGATSGTCTYTTISNYSYSTTTGKLTITGTLTAGDSLEVTYSYYQKYSDTEIIGFIKSAIAYLSIEKYGTFTVKNDNIIFPTPTELGENLIAIIASILVKGDVSSYRTPEFSITFNRGDSIETKIKKFVRQSKKSYGVLIYIDPSATMVYGEED